MRRNLRNPISFAPLLSLPVPIASHRTAVGELNLDGSASISFEDEMTATGALTFAGTASLTFHDEMSASGALTFSGTATIHDAFTPASLGSALKLWLKDGTTYASGTWSDQSGNGYDFAQATTSKRPAAGAINSLAALDYDGTDDNLVSVAHLQTIVGATGSIECAAVFNADTLATHGATEGYEAPPLLRHDLGSRFWFGVDASGVFAGLYDGINFCYAKSAAPSTATTYRARYYFNGSTVLQVQLGTGSLVDATVVPQANMDTRDFTLCAGSNADIPFAGNFDGKLGEIILTTGLTSLQRSSIDNWLRDRWAAQV